MSNYTTPHVTVDVVILSLLQGRLCCLLSKREAAPYEGRWSLPGGYVHADVDETAEDSANRVLSTKAGVQSPYLEQLQTFTGRARDPRGWSISVAYYALVPEHHLTDARSGKTDKETARKWVAVDEAPALPFDHSKILSAAVQRVRAKTLYSTLPTALLPEYFTLNELRLVYEAVLGASLEKTQFRRRLLKLDALEEVPGMTRSDSHRPAQAYRVKPEYRGRIAVASKSLDLRDTVL